MCYLINGHPIYDYLFLAALAVCTIVDDGSSVCTCVSSLLLMPNSRAFGLIIVVTVAALCLLLFCVLLLISSLSFLGNGCVSQSSG